MVGHYMLVTRPGASGSYDEYVRNILWPIPTICQSLQEWGEEPAFLFMCWVIQVPSCALFIYFCGGDRHAGVWHV